MRARPGAINQLAVSDVLARYQSRRASDLAPGVQPHQLKDTVSRALSGRLLSRPALELFIAAFGFSAEEADRLRKLWNGSGSIRVLSGSHAVPPQAEQSIQEALGPRRHQTLTMHDHVYVDAEGRIARTRTMQVIEASAPETDRIPYLYDTSSLTVEAGEGCAGLSGDLRQLGDDVFATEILLGPAARAGRDHHHRVHDHVPLPGQPRRPERAAVPPGRAGVAGELRPADRVPPRPAAGRGVVGDLGWRGRPAAHPGAGAARQPERRAAVPALAAAHCGRVPLVLVAGPKLR